MLQFELFEIPNPCIGVCETAKNGYCIGCLRSRTERQTWYNMHDSEKHRVMILLAKRHKKLKLIQAQKGEQLGLELEILMSTPDLFDQP